MPDALCEGDEGQLRRRQPILLGIETAAAPKRRHGFRQGSFSQFLDGAFDREAACVRRSVGRERERGDRLPRLAEGL